jgi:hypothetical protein
MARWAPVPEPEPEPDDDTDTEIECPHPRRPSDAADPTDATRQPRPPDLDKDAATPRARLPPGRADLSPAGTRPSMHARERAAEDASSSPASPTRPSSRRSSQTPLCPPTLPLSPTHDHPRSRLCPSRETSASTAATAPGRRHFGLIDHPAEKRLDSALVTHSLRPWLDPPTNSKLPAGARTRSLNLLPRRPARSPADRRRLAFARALHVRRPRARGDRHRRHRRLRDRRRRAAAALSRRADRR